MGSPANITGLILAGGAGQRVGHRDKGMIVWRELPLVAHVANLLRPQVSDLMISCNRNVGCYRRYAATVLPDRRAEYQGPLAGLEAASEYLLTEYVAVVGCDMPLLPEDLVARLLGGLATASAAGISYAHDGQREQYLCAVIRRECLATLTDFLDEGQRAVQAWYRRQSCVAVDFSDCSDCFRNYNSLADLRETGTP